MKASDFVAIPIEYRSYVDVETGEEKTYTVQEDMVLDAYQFATLQLLKKIEENTRKVI